MICEKNSASEIKKYNSLSLDSAQNLAEQLKNSVSGIGIYYAANFENYFCDVNNFVISEGSSNTIINTFSARHINEFEWIENAERI